jgi:hypothetical protein
VSKAADRWVLISDRLKSLAARRWLYLALSLTLVATLLLEVVDSRLLSVLTWYHLSFLAISVAMLGAASGAVLVFTARSWFDPSHAERDLARWSLAFAAAVLASHLLNLVIPVPRGGSWTPMEITALAVVVAVLTVPFFFSGIVVTLALTRTGAPAGTLYGFDLLGAATGTLAAIALLNMANLTSAALVSSGSAWLATAAFRRAGGQRAGWGIFVVAIGILTLAGVNADSEWFRVMYPKNRTAWTFPVARSLWNSHAHVLVLEPVRLPAYYWGPDVHAGAFTANHAFMLVDGEAGTPMTEWDGRRESLAWVSHDVTSLPHHVRSGHAGIIGVGGGRDVLAAIWGGSERITGIEINGRILEVLEGSHRGFTRIVDYPGVELVHDEARSYLARQTHKFDVLQMSLVDTWAATGAGAFTLSENGLYTVEGWQVFLDRLQPRGIFSVSRWFADQTPLETSRLLSLAVASLVDRGVAQPSDHLVLVARGNVATLLVSASAFAQEDLQRIQAVASDHGLVVLVSPSHPPPGQLGAIVRSRTRAELAVASANDRFDFTPPDDSRPFFFNMLKPAAWLQDGDPADTAGVMAGNLRATRTLIVLLGVTLGFIVVIIVIPLVVSGRPAMRGVAFASALGYFGAIGAGFMLTQVAFLQRFSVYLGHPTYTFAGVLFSMILFAGLGSFASAAVSGTRERRFLYIPALIAVWLVAAGLVLPRMLAATVHLQLAARLTVVLACSAPLSFLLGFCYPFGARQLARIDQQALAWMWGTNGAAGVLASVVAVMISIWGGIEINFFVAAVCYASVIGFALVLMQTGSSRAAAPRVAHRVEAVQT